MVGDDIKDNPMWEQALLILRAAQECLRTLQNKGVLRVAQGDQAPSQ